MIKIRRMSQWKTLVIDMPGLKEEKRWKALIEYHRTGDILLLQQRLGHKQLRSTFAYLQRVQPLLKLLADNTNFEENSFQ